MPGLSIDCIGTTKNLVALTGYNKLTISNLPSMELGVLLLPDPEVPLGRLCTGFPDITT